jgi:hypothetical protein
MVIILVKEAQLVVVVDDLDLKMCLKERCSIGMAFFIKLQIKTLTI